MFLEADRSWRVPPLQSYNVYRTTNPDVAHREAGRLFARHRLRVVRRRSSFDAQANVADLGGVSVNYVTWGSDVEVDRGPNSGYVGLLFPIGGSLLIRQGHQEFGAEHPRGDGVLLGPEPLTMRWGSESQILSLAVSPSQLARGAARLFGKGTRVPSFHTTSITGNAARLLLSQARLVADIFDTGNASERLSNAVVANLRQAIVNTLLLSVRHYQPDALLAPRPRRHTPRPVAAALELIAVEEGADLTLADLASGSGVGVRALQLAFRRELGTTPAQYLRMARLQRAKVELEAASQSAMRVVDIANKWGFFHAGRFSRLYRDRFGEYPSATLATPMIDAAASGSGKPGQRG
jgi:AraC-like DNA-binding protein